MMISVRECSEKKMPRHTGRLQFPLPSPLARIDQYLLPSRFPSHSFPICRGASAVQWAPINGGAVQCALLVHK